MTASFYQERNDGKQAVLLFYAHQKRQLFRPVTSKMLIINQSFYIKEWAVIAGGTRFREGRKGGEEAGSKERGPMTVLKGFTPPSPKPPKYSVTHTISNFFIKL